MRAFLINHRDAPPLVLKETGYPNPPNSILPDLNPAGFQNANR